MRLLYPLLLLGAAIFALPSPPPDLIPRFPTTPTIDRILSQPANATSPSTVTSNTLCYHDSYGRRVTRESCADLILYLIGRFDFRVPRSWVVSPYNVVWELRGCRLIVVSGKWDDVFSLQDVVGAMERVLATCQPPRYSGVGGTAPVNARPGFVYAAFHAQVMAV